MKHEILVTIEDLESELSSDALYVLENNASIASLDPIEAYSIGKIDALKIMVEKMKTYNIE